MQTEAEHSQPRREKVGLISVEKGQRIDDLSLLYGRFGFIVGAVLGVILGVFVGQSWLIAAIVLGGYGVLLGGVAGMVIGLLRRDLGS